MAYTYEYPRPAVTVDAVVFGLDLEQEYLKVLLIERGGEPYLGSWALPGGFIEMDESLEMAATRELEEETGLRISYMEQLYTFGDPGRDPRGRVISVAYFILVKQDQGVLQAASDARRAEWFALNELPPLAFDHERVLEIALERLRGQISYRPVGFKLLPEKFTLTQIQKLYEIILERELDKRNFRKKILAMGVLEELEEREEGVPHRAAKLYRFDEKKYNQLKKQGFLFSI